MVLSLTCLAYKRESDLGSQPPYEKLGVVIHTCHPQNWGDGDRRLSEVHWPVSHTQWVSNQLRDCISKSKRAIEEKTEC